MCHQFSLCPKSSCWPVRVVSKTFLVRPWAFLSTVRVHHRLSCCRASQATRQSRRPSKGTLHLSWDCLQALEYSYKRTLGTCIWAFQVLQAAHPVRQPCISGMAGTAFCKKPPTAGGVRPPKKESILPRKPSHVLAVPTWLWSGVSEGGEAQPP